LKIWKSSGPQNIEEGRETMSDSFNERMRMIRFRRKRERTRFRDELRIIPRWLFWTCVALWLIAIVIGVSANVYNMRHNQSYFPPDPEWLSYPIAACFALAGVITAGAIFLSAFLFMLGYVYKDAQRRGMHPVLWTLLVLILSPAYGIIGLIIYLLVREPLPFPCPQCSATVSARYNFCPSCKYNLHPSCPQCRREITANDKFCPQCGTDLAHLPQPSSEPPAPSGFGEAAREPL
jgi:Double zinc ribbon